MGSGKSINSILILLVFYFLKDIWIKYGKMRGYIRLYGRYLSIYDVFFCIFVYVKNIL